jgi:hypothetical protein
MDERVLELGVFLVEWPRADLSRLIHMCSYLDFFYTFTTTG